MRNERPAIAEQYRLLVVEERLRREQMQDPSLVPQERLKAFAAWSAAAERLAAVGARLRSAGDHDGRDS